MNVIRLEDRDLDALLHAADPVSSDDIGRVASSAAADDVHKSIVGDQPEATRSRRSRWIAAGCLGAAAAAVIPLMLPSGAPDGPDPAQAAALRHLAVVAGSQGMTAGPHQYGYTRTRPLAASASGTRTASRSADLDQQTWIAADTGREWFAPGNDGRSCLLTQKVVYTNVAPYIPSAREGNYGTGSVAQLATLPTNASVLSRFIDHHPSGQLRGVRNRMESVGDLMRDPLTPPKLRAAAVDVLVNTAGLTVDVNARDALGRSAIEVTGRDYSLYFAPNTSQLLQDDGSVILANNAVDALPRLPRCTLSTSITRIHNGYLIAPTPHQSSR